MPTRLKGKFYRTTIRSALLYGVECCAVKQFHIQKMSVTKMRMLCWMCGHTRKDHVRNDTIRQMVGVAPIEDKMRERAYGGLVMCVEDRVMHLSDEMRCVEKRQGREEEEGPNRRGLRESEVICFFLG
ncbi:unnamed protein product [Cuscuta epithymum]|uniref:Uncharacterized protein n=1 Tax=Cuscuta epithymum TaxID=186058 RepID=A0AAV0CI90_9ASTE|nr:unnamed protein product [Cuscuta epithymum]